MSNREDFTVKPCGHTVTIIGGGVLHRLCDHCLQAIEDYRAKLELRAAFWEQI